MLGEDGDQRGDRGLPQTTQMSQPDEYVNGIFQQAQSLRKRIDLFINKKEEIVAGDLQHGIDEFRVPSESVHEVLVQDESLIVVQEGAIYPA